MEGPTTFFLMGVCKFSFLWKFTSNYPFLIKNKAEWGVPHFQNGYRSNHKLFYNESSDAWEFVEFQEDISYKLMASVKSTKNNLALGSNVWTIYDDDKECNKNEGNSYKKILTFSACDDTEFTCNDGNCVAMERRCDGKIDCSDKSDEIGCNLIKFDPSYSKDIAPPPMKNSNVSDLFISVDIKKILKVDELGEVFKIKFSLYITWNDPRLTYQNLKKDPNLNVLRLEGQKNIWAPVIIFENTEESDQSKIDEKSLIRVLSNKDFKYKKSDKSEIRNTYYFQDPEDVLQLSRTYKIDFICSYNMALFPFDTQTCSMNFQLDEVTQPHLMAYKTNCSGVYFVPQNIVPKLFFHGINPLDYCWKGNRSVDFQS